MPLPPGAAPGTAAATLRHARQAMSLYRSLLRLHRHLPPDIRYVGDKYVRDEWRLHRGVSDPGLLVAFFTAWRDYGQALAPQIQAQRSSGSSPPDPLALGKALTESDLDAFTPEQVGQLHELWQESSKPKLP
jgi:hypothetical protein